MRSRHFQVFGGVPCRGKVAGASQIGVIASLIYLSRQVRQNTRAVRMANAAGGQNNFQQLARFLYEDREGCALIRPSRRYAQLELTAK